MAWQRAAAHDEEWRGGTELGGAAVGGRAGRGGAVGVAGRQWVAALACSSASSHAHCSAPKKSPTPSALYGSRLRRLSSSSTLTVPATRCERESVLRRRPSCGEVCWAARELEASFHERRCRGRLGARGRASRTRRRVSAAPSQPARPESRGTAAACRCGCGAQPTARDAEVEEGVGPRREQRWRWVRAFS